MNEQAQVTSSNVNKHEALVTLVMYDPCTVPKDYFTPVLECATPRNPILRFEQACCPENARRQCTVPWAALGEGVPQTASSDFSKGLQLTVLTVILV